MTTYNILREDLITYAARTNDNRVSSAIPTFIRNAEAKFARKIRTSENQVDQDITIDSTGRTDLPDGFLGFRSVTIKTQIQGSNTSVDYMTPDQFAEFQGVGSLISGIDRENAFTLVRDQIRFKPEPGEGDTVTLETVYYERFPAISNDTPTNWLLTNHYDIYLEGCLAELWHFLQDELMEDRHRNKTDSMIEDLNRSERKKQKSGPLKRRIVGRFLP